MGAIKAAGQVLLSSAEWSPRVEHASDEEGNEEEVAPQKKSGIMLESCDKSCSAKTMIKMS
jgi:hypothetical protein